MKIYCSIVLAVLIQFVFADARFTFGVDPNKQDIQDNGGEDHGKGYKPSKPTEPFKPRGTKSPSSEDKSEPPSSFNIRYTKAPSREQHEVTKAPSNVRGPKSPTAEHHDGHGSR